MASVPLHYYAKYQIHYRIKPDSFHQWFFKCIRTAIAGLILNVVSYLAIILLVIIIICTVAQKLFFKYAFDDGTSDESKAAVRKRKKEEKRRRKLEQKGGVA